MFNLSLFLRGFCNPVNFSTPATLILAYFKLFIMILMLSSSDRIVSNYESDFYVFDSLDSCFSVLSDVANHCVSDGKDLMHFDFRF